MTINDDGKQGQGSHLCNALRCRVVVGVDGRNAVIQNPGAEGEHEAESQPPIVRAEDDEHDQGDGDHTYLGQFPESVEGIGGEPGGPRRIPLDAESDVEDENADNGEAGQHVGPYSAGTEHERPADQYEGEEGNGAVERGK